MKRTSLLLSLLLLPAAGAAMADSVTIAIDNAPITAAAGQTVTVDATMTENFGVAEYLNGDDINLPPGLASSTTDDSAFFNNWPLSLAANGGYGPAAIFDLSLAAGVAPGSYSVIFDLLGGPGANDQNLLGTAAFTVNVQNPTATPEPATWTLLLLGVAVGAVALRRPDLLRVGPLAIHEKRFIH